MGHWTLDDIPWQRFDAARVDAEILAVVKAAALVERNAADYVTYLANVFADDTEFRAAAAEWGVEEIQHGEALGRWAERADAGFDFAASLGRFVAGYRLPLDATASVRGSRSGELIARCVVETGTSSFYSALRDAAGEPVLKIICAKIAGDEFRHYKLFYGHLQRYLAGEAPGRWRRLAVVLGRLGEVDDDELAFAYHCANGCGEPYERKRAARAYAAGAYRHYRETHVRRAAAMMLKAAGVSPQGRLGDLAGRLAWAYMRRQARRLAA